ncbi:MAG: hypothetical protein K0R12_879 [Gammaproteobacteria bacterium]|nr:hypothetical protein [Gammaproteobacteria bacterium]
MNKKYKNPGTFITESVQASPAARALSRAAGEGAAQPIKFYPQELVWQ